MAYRPATQRRFDQIRAQGAANERLHSSWKHGGGPAATASRHSYTDEELFGLSDEEMDAKTRSYTDEELFGLSDDDLDALEQDQASAPPILRKNEATGQDERSAAQALNVWDLASLGHGDEAMGGMAAIGTYVTSGGDSDAAGKAYDEEAKYARDLKERWHAQPDQTWGDIGSHAAGFVAGAPAGVGLFKAAAAVPAVARGVVGGGRALLGGRGVAQVIPAAVKAATPTTRAGKIVDTGVQLGLTGAGATEGFLYGDATGTPAQRFAAVRAAGGAPAAAGGLLGIGAGVLGAGGVRVAQRVGQAFRSPENKAARYIAEKLIGANQTADDLAAAHAKAAETGKPVALGDVGPQGVKDAGAAAARTPGPGREQAQATLVPRQEGQVARVSEDVGKAVGGKPGSFTKTTDDLVAARQAEAKPLYDQAFASNKPVISPKIVEIANRPSGKAAIQKGLKIAQDEGIPESELVIRDANGNVIGYSAKGLHYAKMALDDMIEAATRTGDLSAARAFTIMKKELLGEMDRHIPGYAKAREAFAGHSANKSALEKGRRAVNSHPDQIKSEMAGMSEGEREFYRRGYAQRIIETVEASPDKGNAVNRIFGNTAKRDRLRAVLGDEEYNRLAERLGVEDAMYGSFRRTNVGSETAERQAAQNDLDEYLFGQTPGLAQAIGASFRFASIRPLINGVGMSGIVTMLRGISQRARGQIVKLLFLTDPNDVRQAVQMIRHEHANALKFKQAQDAAIAQSAANEDLRTTLPPAAAVAGGHVAGAAGDIANAGFRYVTPF